MLHHGTLGSEPYTVSFKALKGVKTNCFRYVRLSDELKQANVMTHRETEVPVQKKDPFDPTLNKLLITWAFIELLAGAEQTAAFHC